MKLLIKKKNHFNKYNRILFFMNAYRLFRHINQRILDHYQNSIHQCYFSLDNVDK